MRGDPAQRDAKSDLADLPQKPNNGDGGNLDSRLDGVFAVDVPEDPPEKPHKAYFASRRVVLFFSALAVISIIIGILVIVYSFSIQDTLKRRSYVSDSIREFATDGMAGGALCIASGVVALLAYSRRSRKLLALAGLLSISFIILEIVVCVEVVRYGSALGAVQGALPSSLLSDFTQIQMNNIVLSIYIKCCSGCPLRNQCDNPHPDSYANYSLSYCSYPSNCTVPGPCVNEIQDSCFIDRSDIRRTGRNITIPSNLIDETICHDLEAISSNGIAIVGPAVLGSCGGGSPTEFRASLATSVSNESVPFFSLYLTVALIQLCSLFFSLYLFSTTSATYHLQQSRFPVAKGVRVESVASEAHDPPPRSATPVLTPSMLASNHDGGASLDLVPVSNSTSNVATAGDKDAAAAEQTMGEVALV